jgi:hypothetical protein
MSGYATYQELGYMSYTFIQPTMKPRYLLVFTAVLFSMQVVEKGLPTKGRHQYAAPDGGASVTVVPVSKEAGRAEYESRIEFHSGDGATLCVLDYSSEDSEHGFGLVKGQWTPDSKYFVFSLTSSGGHQAWHAPTQFFNRQDGTIRSLDDYFAASGVSESDFRLVAPDIVKTEVLRDKAVPVSISLTALPPLRSWRKNKPFLVACSTGRVFRPDGP